MRRHIDIVSTTACVRVTSGRIRTLYLFLVHLGEHVVGLDGGVLLHFVI